MEARACVRACEERRACVEKRMRVRARTQAEALACSPVFSVLKSQLRFAPALGRVLRLSLALGVSCQDGLTFLRPQPELGGQWPRAGTRDGAPV